MAKKKKDAPLPEKYSRRFVIDRLLSQADQDGMAGIGAVKELRSMLKEEQPDIDLIIDAYFVPIVFDDTKFIASLSKATKI
jgi:hypothetical protein